MAAYYDLGLPASLSPSEAVLLAEEDRCCVVALETTLADRTLLPYPPLPRPQFQDSKVRVLRRVTLEVSDAKHLMQLGMNSAVQEGIDILAIRPLTEKVFVSICKDCPQFDIITFDASERLPFMLKRGQVQDALRNGLSFEMSYGPVLADPGARKTALSNIAALFAATKGKNTIISSGARNPIYHRMPFQVVSLLCSLGVRKDHAFMAVSANPAECLARARFIRMFKGTVEQADAADLLLFNEKKKKKELARLKKLEKQIEKGSPALL